LITVTAPEESTAELKRLYDLHREAWEKSDRLRGEYEQAYAETGKALRGFESAIDSASGRTFNWEESWAYFDGTHIAVNIPDCPESGQSFDAAESSMRKKLNQLFELRSATVELKKRLAETAKAGNALFDQFQDEFKASLQVKKVPRANKLKLETAGV